MSTPNLNPTDCWLLEAPNHHGYYLANTPTRGGKLGEVKEWGTYDPNAAMKFASKEGAEDHAIGLPQAWIATGHMFVGANKSPTMTPEQRGPQVTEADRQAGDACWMDERFPQLTPELEVIQMIYRRFAAHRHAAVEVHAAHIKGFMAELSEYLGIDGPKKPADYLKAASEIREKYAEQQSKLAAVEAAVAEYKKGFEVMQQAALDQQSERLQFKRERNEARAQLAAKDEETKAFVDSALHERETDRICHEQSISVIKERIDAIMEQLAVSIAEADRLREALQSALTDLHGLEELRTKPPLTDHELDSGHDYTAEVDELETELNGIRGNIAAALATERTQQPNNLMSDQTTPAVGQAAQPEGNPLPSETVTQIIKTKELRVGLDAQLQTLKALPGSRERSLSITKIQEAIMWLGMDLKRLNDTRPYPSSYDPTNAKVEPTADGLKL